MKYVIYLRVSTKEQDLRTQEQKCLSYLKSLGNSDFKYLIFTDSITSKKPLHKRKGLNDALNALERGDVLVGQRVDRLARNELEAHKIKEFLLNNKIGIMMIDQPGIKDPLIFSVYAAMAAQEVTLIRERIKDKLWAKKERKERTGKVPYGFTLDNEALVLVNGENKQKVLKPGLLLEDNSEQVILNQMTELFDVGLSYRRIAEVLTDLGYHNRVKKPFQANSIYRILRRIGKVRSKGQPLEDSKPLWSRSA
jgi:DNA invertase Pin-like site-specific DNA recombinase